MNAKALAGAVAVILASMLPVTGVHAQPSRSCSASAGWIGAQAGCVSNGDGTDLTPVLNDGHTYTYVSVCGVASGGLCHEPTLCHDSAGNEGTWVELYRDGKPTGQVSCATGAEAREQQIVTPGLVVNAFRSLDWPGSELVIQPPRGRTLVNFETNFYTENTSPTTQTVRLLGQRITIEATPKEYIWTFGDGEQTSTSDPGAAYPRLDVTHNYLETGEYRPAVDTVYSGRFRVGNGPWRDVPATLTVPGQSQVLEAIEARPMLVG